MLGLKVVQVRKHSVVSLYQGHSNPTRWHPGKLHAECIVGRNPFRIMMNFTGTKQPEDRGEHPAPTEGCLCGFHGVYSLETLGEHLNDREETENNRVVALIEGWGKTVKHEKGWRSEYARLSNIVDISDHPWAIRDHDRRIIYKGYALRAAQLTKVPIVMLHELPELQVLELEAENEQT